MGAARHPLVRAGGIRSASLWLVRRRLRTDGRRALILVLVITVAATSFTVLGGVQTWRLEIVGAPAPAPVASYDLLVLPADAPGSAEQSGPHSLVRPRRWQDVYGGITLTQSQQIQEMPGVDIAAPIAMVGYILQTVHVAVPIPPAQLDAPALYSASITHTTDQGLSTVVSPNVAFTYVTPDPLTDPLAHTADKRCPVDTGADAAHGGDPFAVQTRRAGTCWSTRTGPTTKWAGNTPWPSVQDTWTFPTLVAAVDPAAEAALHGLDQAITAGRYLPQQAPAGRDAAIPVIRADTLAGDDKDTVVVAKLPSRAVARVEPDMTPAQIDRLVSATPRAVVATRTVTSTQAYRQLVDEELASGRQHSVDTFWTTTPVDYVGHGDGRLSVTPQPTPSPRTWQQSDATTRRAPPVDASDSAARGLVAHTSTSPPGAEEASRPRLATVGTFGPNGPAADGESVPAFGADLLPGADAASQRALGGRELPPNANPAAYPAGGPTMLMPLDRIDAFTDPAVFSDVNQAAPVSAIRVRVAGVTGTDPLSRERVRTVADEISKTTRLRVDVTLGATPTEVPVTIPAGRHGRPQLTVRETWFRTSVDVVSVPAQERKSTVLLFLLLLVCGLAIANATAASTRALALELRQQARLGLLPGAIFRHLLAEVGLLALAAGLLSAVLTWPVAVASQAPGLPLHPLLAVPVALVVGLSAAVIPAWRASGAAHSVLAVGLPPVRRLHARGRLRVAAVHLLRTPGRSARCVAAVAIGCAAVTVQLMLTWVWHGAVVGELLGVPVSLQDRWVDAAATALIALMSAFVVADVGWLAVRDRRAELADLRVQGLLATQLAGLVVREMTILVLVGAALGGLVGATVAAGLGSA